MNYIIHSETKTGIDVPISAQKPLYLRNKRKELPPLGREVARQWVEGTQVVFRVVNGRRAALGQFPYQVSFRAQVRRTNVFMNFCGGAVITPSEVLTAAHCFKTDTMLESCCGRHAGRATEERVKGIFAVAGTVYTASHFHDPASTDAAEEKHGQWRRLRAVRFPRSYNFPEDDIAVVFLVGSYKWTATVKPIPYAETAVNYKGSCLVSGYGRIKHVKRTPRLLFAELHMMNPRKCSRVHARDMSKMICSADEVADIGKGDSGGPLVCRNTGDPKELALGILVGVVSGSKRGVRFGSYFTRVSSFAQYINETIKSGPNDAPNAQLSEILMVACAVHLLYCTIQSV
ncbi:hypothetical protein O0L34_g12042 [Tuta absoluta]|nr:hypothetical protein O0L34_g12042 [Tuta absoluta]